MVRNLLSSALILIAAVHTASATFNLVNQPSVGIVFNSNTITVPLPTIGSGHALVLHLWYVSSAPVSVESITGGGSYALAPSCGAFLSSNALGVNCAYVLSSTGGDTSVTVTLSRSVISLVADFREYGFTAVSVAFSAAANATEKCKTQCAGIVLPPLYDNNLIVQSIGSPFVTGVSPYFTPYVDVEINSISAVADRLNTNYGFGPEWLRSPGGPSEVLLTAVALTEQ